MTLRTAEAADVERRRWGLRRTLALGGAAAVTVVLAVASLCIGSSTLSAADAWRALLWPDDSFASVIVHEQRLPRTVLVVLVGAALGAAGSLMQSLTRNPLADPGVLGINAGASLAVVLAVAVTGFVGGWFTVWFALAGAAVAALVVGAVGGTGRGGAPVRLALAGIAVSMAVSSIVQTVILADQNAYNEFRFWASGSVEGRGFDVVWTVAGFIVAGLVIALAVSPALNALALGDETAAALGVRIAAVRATVLVAVTLLAGAATAAAGPIMFVGLGVPYVARALCGPDQRWALPCTILAAPAMLLAADLLARVVAAPQEVPVGVVAAIIGGPVFVALARRRRIEAL